jgi:hypothetical protein
MVRLIIKTCRDYHEQLHIDEVFGSTTSPVHLSALKRKFNSERRFNSAVHPVAQDQINTPDIVFMPDGGREVVRLRSPIQNRMNA